MADRDLELTFHIGMGKTGTSAIQASLGRAGAQLREQGLSYLGMWWSVADPRYEGPEGIEAAAELDAEQSRALARRLVEHIRELAQREGVRHFVFSNEALYSHTDAYEPFYAELAEHVDLRFVVFVREPRQWLASAYAQWGIRHRDPAGASSSFREWAAGHLGIYGGLRYWHRRFGDRLIVRGYEPEHDVVPVFMDAIGCALELPERRVYPTPEPALLMLQAVYESMPTRTGAPPSFARDVYDFEVHGTPLSTEELIDQHFDQSQMPQLLERWRPVFEEIREMTGIDLLAEGTEGLPAPKPGYLRGRMFDCLMAIVMEQARRIAALEARLDEARDETVGSS